MNRTVLSRRITRIQSDIEKLSNTLCAMDKTDIETYPENYEMLSTDAALRSELITCKVRHLIYSSTGLKKAQYLTAAGIVQGIGITCQNDLLEITLPCLLPKRKQRQSTEFLIDPIYFTLSQYADSHVLPNLNTALSAFRTIYSQELPLRRVRDYDQSGTETAFRRHFHLCDGG